MTDSGNKGFWSSEVGTTILEIGTFSIIGAVLGAIIGAIFCTIQQNFSAFFYFVIGAPIILILHVHVETYLDKHLTTYRKNGARPPFYKDSTVLESVIDFAFITVLMTLALEVTVQNHRYWLIPLGIVFSTVIIGIGCLIDRRRFWKKAEQPLGHGNGKNGIPDDGTASGDDVDPKNNGDTGDDDDDEIQMPYYTPEIWM